MKNNKILTGVGFVIVFVLYNFLVFTLAGEKTNQFWSAYIFTVVAFVIQITVYLVLYRKKNELKDIFFGIPLTAISLMYLGIQIIIGILLMLIPIGITAANIIQVVILCAYLFLSISALIGKNVIKDIDDKTNEKVFYIRSLESDILGFMDNVKDSALQKKLNDLSETIRYSDPMSHASLSVVEQRIVTKVAMLAEKIDLEDYTAASELCNEVEVLFADRNRKCKLLK